jgi:hypothetical protein
MITIIYGPQASGKTRNRDALAKHYEHTTVIDGVSRHHRSRKFYDDSGRVHTEIPSDALLLTTMSRRECARFLDKHEVTGTLVPIDEALKEIAQ